MSKEIRTFNVQFEHRSEDDPKIRGHAAVFNSLSQDLGGFREQIAPGAFARAITEDDVRALQNHNADIVLGRTKSGTLRLSEDDKGLAIEIDPPDTQQARDLMTLIERGDVDQMSFAFLTRKDQWEETDDGEITRTLLDVKLFDVSPVTYPAYEQTDVAVRSLQEFLEHQYSTEDAKRKLQLAEERS